MRNVGRHPAAFRFLIVVLLLLGIFFRFVNLGGKVYWHDEAYTSVRISGYKWTEVLEEVFDGRVIGVEDLAKFQRPNYEKNLIDTIKTLAIDDAQHPPLYYVMARLWMQMFGDSSDIKTAPLQIRSLSALISLLVFPCVYWLCLELFKSPLVGWWAMALIAISPVHILYAQEAREYALWTVTILLSSAALLRARRRIDAINSVSIWGIYAASLAVGFYTFPFTGLVLIGHGIYVLAMEKFRWTKKAIAFLLASAAGIIAFAPWIVVVITNFSQVQRTTGWMGDIKVPLLSMIKTWGLHVSRIFVDWEFGFDSLFTYLIPPIFVIMVAYCLYFVYRQSSKQVWVFIFTLVGVTSLALILPDLIFGGIRSASNRYLIPCVLGIQLAVAYLLATKIAEANLLERRIWQAIMTVLISCGVMSCAIASFASTSWIKVVSYNIPYLARIINTAPQPLLLGNSFAINPGNIFSLSYLLDKKVRLQLVVDPNIPNIHDNFSDVFVLNPTRELQAGLEKEYKSKIDSAFRDEYIWLGKLAKR